ncbi:MAG: DUF3603 family protein [Bacilli bacterium]|nr:DUF3603 family protein [Bacilli bacterium]
MNYIYDIFLNFNETLYDIYEWNRNDNIIHIRKIPLFKVDKKTMYDFITKKIELSNDFLTKIFKKTEIFGKNKIDNINYSFLISDGIDAVAIKLGNKYSRLLIEEEREVIDYVKSIKPITIDYKIIKSNKKTIFKTRNEIKIKEYIFKKVNELIKCNDYDKLKYLYLDCFNKNIENDVDKLFLLELNKNWDSVYLKLYNLLKLIETR